jgi:hypothetical protein
VSRDDTDRKLCGEDYARCLSAGGKSSALLESCASECTTAKANQTCGL